MNSYPNLVLFRLFWRQSRQNNRKDNLSTLPQAEKAGAA
jgi:hypothetical protein